MRVAVQVLDAYAEKSGKAWEPIRRKLDEGEFMY